MVLGSFAKRTLLNPGSVTRVSAGTKLTYASNVPIPTLWVEFDYGTSIDSASEPWVYSSVTNRGTLGGTFSSAGAARLQVAHIESGSFARQVARGDGSATYADWSAALADQKFLHGDKVMIDLTLRVNSFTAGDTVIDSCAWGGGNTGILVYVSAVGQLTIVLNNGTGTTCVAYTTGSNNIVAGTVHTVTLIHDSTRSPQTEVLVDGVQVNTHAMTGTPSTGNATYSLRLGHRNSGGTAFDGQILALVARVGTYVAAEGALVRGYLSAKYQQQNAQSLQVPTFYFNLSVYDDYTIDTGNAEPGDQVNRIIDLSGNIHTAIQNTDAKQGTLGTDSDGNTEIAVDGTADYYGVAAGGGWPSGTSHTIWAELDSDNPTVPTEFLFDFQTGRLALGTRMGGTGKAGIYISGYTGVADNIAGEQSLEWHLDDTANTVSMYRTGQYLGEGAYIGSIAMGGTVTLGIHHNGSSAPWDGAFQELWARDSLQSTTEIFESRAARAARYPTRWADTLPLVVPVGPEGCWFDTSDAANFVLDGTDIIVAKDCSRLIDDPVSNGDFETGSPPSDWTAISGDTLSAQAGARTGGSGSQILRGRIEIGDTLGYAVQSCLTVGQRSMFDIWMRGDGTNGYPRVTDSGGVNVWTGTTSNTWQHAIAVVNSNHADLTLQTRGDNATQDYAEFDDLIVTPGNHAYQPTAANRPTYDVANGCMNFVAANSEWADTGIVPGVAGSVDLWVKQTAGTYAWGAYNAGANKLWLQNSGGNWLLALGTDTLPSGVAVSGAWQHVTCTWGAGAYSITVDGTRVTGTYTSGLPTIAIFLACRNLIGVANTFSDVQISGYQHRPYAMTADQIAYLHTLGRNP